MHIVEFLVGTALYVQPLPQLACFTELVAQSSLMCESQNLSPF